MASSFVYFNKMFISVFILLTSFVCVGFSYNILAIFPFQSKSHYALIDPLMLRLSELGHHVTIYSHFPKKRTIPNYNEVDISKCFAFPDGNEFNSIDAMMSMAANSYSNLLMLFMVSQTLYTIESVEKCPPLKALLNSTAEYDLFMTESFVSDAMLLFANKFQTPIVTYIPNILLPWLSDRMANPINPSYMPIMVSGYPSEMTFIERVQNTLLHLVAHLGYNYITLKNENEIVKHCLGSSAPSLYDTVKNTSIIFINAHESLNPVVPLVPGIKSIAGIHVKPIAPLPKVRSSFEY